jgi:hypothetical protein
MTANEPLSYEPAGSRVVTLSVVPTVIDVAAPSDESLLLPEVPAQPETARAVTANAAVTVAIRLPVVDADAISVSPSVNVRTQEARRQNCCDAAVLGVFLY